MLSVLPPIGKRKTICIWFFFLTNTSALDNNINPTSKEKTTASAIHSGSKQEKLSVVHQNTLSLCFREDGFSPRLHFLSSLAIKYGHDLELLPVGRECKRCVPLPAQGLRMGLSLPPAGTHPLQLARLTKQTRALHHPIKEQNKPLHLSSN